jgi:beta-glucosidase
LYEFGRGLSYTSFSYSNLQVPDVVTPGTDVIVRVDVENTGNRAGDEAVLLFIDDVVSSVTTPVKELKDFKRIHLKPGEKVGVEFMLSFSQLALYDINLQKVVEPGVFRVMIGELVSEFEIK